MRKLAANHQCTNCQMPPPPPVISRRSSTRRAYGGSRRERSQQRLGEDQEKRQGRAYCTALRLRLNLSLSSGRVNAVSRPWHPSIWCTAASASRALDLYLNRPFRSPRGANGSLSGSVPARCSKLAPEVVVADERGTLAGAEVRADLRMQAAAPRATFDRRDTRRGAVTATLSFCVA